MKSFFHYLSNISNKLKSLYVLWFLINLIILLISGNGFARYDRDFYPFTTMAIWCLIHGTMIMANLLFTQLHQFLYF